MFVGCVHRTKAHEHVHITRRKNTEQTSKIVTKLLALWVRLCNYIHFMVHEQS